MINKMEVGGKVLLFSSSYLPCWLIWAVSQGFKFNVVSIAGIIMFFVSIITLYIFKQSYEFVNFDDGNSIYVNNISNGSSEVVSYLLTLVIPILKSQNFINILSSGVTVELLSTLIIAITILIIYINSNLVVINPMLLIIGYSLYKIVYKVDEDSKVVIEGILIIKGHLDPEKIKHELYASKVDKNIYLAKMM